MGDASRTSGNISPTERQFLEDLERAKKLSLESYGKQQIRLQGKTGYLSYFPVENTRRSSMDIVQYKSGESADMTSRPRPTSRDIYATPNKPKAVDNFKDSPTPNSIPPPTFKRQSSLPSRSRRSGSHPSTQTSSTSGNDTGNGNQQTDDLIHLASPKISHKKLDPKDLEAEFIFNSSAENRISLAHSNGSVDGVFSDKGNVVSPILNPHLRMISPLYSNPVDNTSSARNQSSPVFPVWKPTESQFFPPTPSSSSLDIKDKPIVPPMKQTGNVYGKLSEDLKQLSNSDDLIDFGQRDPQKILEDFDPLVLRGSVKEQQRKTAFSSEPVNFITNKSNGATPVQDCVPSTSNRTSSASTHSSMSLYPSLDEFEGESIYSSLTGQDFVEDESSFYNVYNPYEYFYAVSCSTPSVYSSASESKGAEAEGRGDGHLKHPDFSELSAKFPKTERDSNNSATESKLFRNSSKYRNRLPSLCRKKGKRQGKLYENIESIKNMSVATNEIQAFYQMLRKLRHSFQHSDHQTNLGYIRAATHEINNFSKGLSLKIVVWNESFTKDPVMFTCDVSATVELVVEQCLVELQIEGCGSDYILRVKGLNEYLDPEKMLAHFRYVQECIKLDVDVHFVLCQRTSLDKHSWARTHHDDRKVSDFTIENILPQTPSKTITYQEISRFLEVFDKESEKIKTKLNSSPSQSSSNTKDNLFVNPAPIIQLVKGVCVLLGKVETVEMKNSLDALIKTCEDWSSKTKYVSSSEKETTRRTLIGSDYSNRHSYVEIIPRSKSNSNMDDPFKTALLNAVDNVEESLRIQIEMYSTSFPVSFRMKEVPNTTRAAEPEGCKMMSEISECFMVRVGGIHRLKSEWLTTYSEYFLTVELFHGTRWMGKTNTPNVAITKGDNNLFFTTIVIDSCVTFDHLPFCIIPREARLVITLHGIKQPDDNGVIPEPEELSWASMQCFNYKGMLAQGHYLLPFWPMGLVQRKLGPAPNSSFSSDEDAPLLTIELADFGYDLYFPEIPTAVIKARDFQSLDNNTQVLLMDIVENCTFTKFPADEREVLWEKRHYLNEYPNALPKVILAAQLWDYASLAELHAMLQKWRPLDPVDALQLLLPCFPDAKVREVGIRWSSHMTNEELINLLPQLVEALSYETFDLSPLAEFLLKKSLSCLKVSHTLFWLLVSQVGIGKWASDISTATVDSTKITDDNISYDPKRRRLELMLNSLMVICGAKWKTALIKQVKMIKVFTGVGTIVKNTNSSNRSAVLTQQLHKVDLNVLGTCDSFPLPLSPSYDVLSIDTSSSSFYNSASVPLKVSFLNRLPESGTVSTLFKIGDDLRQDVLTIQIIRVMEKWWMEEGLDLRVLTFNCVPTGHKQGMIEMVQNSETLCRIQRDYGVTGVFRDRPISEWLAKMNPSTLDYRRSIENFTHSCAAYCVVTYVLGICDRHNDNIMLTTKGHLFHIDFGKFLGDAQMFGSFKRDRTPFVLTSDMVYVINDGEKESNRFHKFVDLCCQAFRIVRKNGNTLINLFALMATAGISGVNLSSVSYIQRALMPECSNVQADARFTRFIKESLQDWFTSVNFFIHSLAQLRFSSENSGTATTLSFVPTVYKMEGDGRIERAEVISFEKKYDPEKYYVYRIRVKRKNQTEVSILHRSYKEFLEFHSKLCINFPMAIGSLKPLPRASGFGRSNVKQVAEKRKFQLHLFLDSLFTLADEISHSDLVYTFFHPLLRDEETDWDEDEKDSIKSRIQSRNPSRIHGQIKLSLEYQRVALHVLVLHAEGLSCPTGQLPSPYVKIYLQPDMCRLTKRKTRVIRRSQNPTFMEMIEYRLPLEMIRQRRLQVSVWHHDPLQENNFLGGVSISLASINLERETTETYILENITSLT